MTFHRCRWPNTMPDVNGDGHTDLGDMINWSFLVKNTGTVTLTVAVTDPRPARSPARPRRWLPARPRPARRAPHTITQADVDAGVVNNTATATGKNPATRTVTSNASSTDTPVDQASALQLTKSAAVTDVNGDGKTDLGDKIQWSFLVKNTGTATITDGRGHRPEGRRGDLPGHDAGAGRLDDLHGDAPHTITQADVDAGVVTNTATATGKTRAATTVTSNPVVDRHPGHPDRRRCS